MILKLSPSVLNAHLEHSFFLLVKIRKFRLETFEENSGYRCSLGVEWVNVVNSLFH